MRSVSGWTIAHVSDVQRGKVSLGHEEGVVSVTIEHADARLNGQDIYPVNALQFAMPGWTYAVRFKKGTVIDAVVLQRG